MDTLSNLLVENNIYFNFFAFAYLLATTFTALLGVFLIMLKDKSRSTTHMGITFLWLAIFNSVYIFAHSYYGAEGAFHRWVTVGLILFPLTHFVQWIFKFPEIRNIKTSRTILAIMYLISIVFTVMFINLSFKVGSRFLFTGHHWDFKADEFSSMFGKVIVAYLLTYIIAATWRAFTVKGKDRLSIILISFAFVVIGIVPSILNVMSRNGAMARSTFIISYVLFGVVGYFLILILYLNRTHDRTTFMVKIVGISLVTFLLLMQFLSMQTLGERENDYDELRIEYAQRALEKGKKHDDIEYIVRYANNKTQVEFKKQGMDLPQFDNYIQEFKNTVYFQEISSIGPDEFKSTLMQKLKSNDDFNFSGYKVSLVNYLEKSELNGLELKEDVLDHIESLNTIARVASTKIGKMHPEAFRKELNQYIGSPSDKLAPFARAIQTHMTANPELSDIELEQQIYQFISPFKPEHTRHYRKIANESSKNFKHFNSFIFYIPGDGSIAEVGFSYRDYRYYIHKMAFNQVIILFIVLVVLVVVFPFFFKGSLLDPLNALVRGIRKVNKGDLDVQVEIHVQDEIGFLSESFNKMVVSIHEAQEKLQDYAHNLEEKVNARTAELNETLESVKKLKVQQDGDYFLTALLQKPLNYDANKSDLVKTEMFLEQKKKFDFRNKHSDLGGDLCVTGNLRLGTENDYRRYVVAINADAMGKSMQGAGGALVLGVVINSIMARSAKGDRILDVTPEEWLTDVYEEIHGVFLAFNGSMVISASMSMIDEQSGEMWYFNAEHPFQVLYRNKAASFIEEELLLRKIGLESEIPFKVYYTKLEPGDVVIMGSDGRDDIDTTPDADVRTINDDEFIFLKRVEESDGKLDAIVQSLRDFGDLTDDLSFLRIAFQETESIIGDAKVAPEAKKTVIDIDVVDEANLVTGSENFQELFDKGRELAKEGRHAEALDILNGAYEMNSNDQALNKVMAILTFKEKEYERAINIIEDYLEKDNDVEDFWLYLSIAHKHSGDQDKALEAAQKVYEMNPDRVVNLVNIADIYNTRGNKGLAREFIDKALQLDPENRQAKTIETQLAS